MKTSTLVLGIIAAAGAGASIYLSTQLSSAHEQLEQEQRARSADATRIRELEGQLQGREATAPPLPARPGQAAPGAKTPSGSQARAAGDPEFGMPPPPIERPGSPNSQLEVRSSNRMQQEIRLRRFYSDMPAALGLDAAQADKLFDLLADSAVAEVNSMRGYMDDPAARASIEASAREQREAAIESLLGPDKAAEFQSYEKAMPARMQVNRVNETMAVANVPLSDAQKSAMVAIFVKEQDARPPPQRPAGNDFNAEYELRYLDWQYDYSRRVQASVEPLLGSEQVRQYRQAMEGQNERRDRQRSRIEARRNAAAKP